MRILSNDGKEFDTMEACKEYEAKVEDNGYREKLLKTITDLDAKIHKWIARETDLIDQYRDKYPDYCDELIEAMGWSDEEDEPDCDDCENFDACVIEAAVDMVIAFDKLRSLIYDLD